MIPETGTYWLGFQGDDGGFLELPGQTFDRIVQDASGGAVGESSERIACDCLVGNNRTVGEITLEAGTYPIRFLWFEAGINASFEVFGAEAGANALYLLEKDGPTTRDAIGGVSLVVDTDASPIIITSVNLVETDFQITWDASESQSYIIERSENLRDDWTMLETSYPEGGAAEGVLSYRDTNSPLRRSFYRIAQAEPPAYLATGFENGAEGWQAGVKEGDSGSTQWQVGAPASGPGSAYEGDQIYATNLEGDYGNDARITLRSPVIDLSQAVRPNLEFWFYLEADDPEGGQVNVLSADGTPIREQLFLFTGELSGPNWRRAITRLPSEALGQSVIIEFEFLSDDALPNGAGWYIDAVRVSE